MNIIEKYIDLHEENNYNISWSCGLRLPFLMEEKSEFYCYVTMTDNKGFHTVLGNVLSEMLKICYTEFIEGKRNNFPPYVRKKHHKSLSEKIKEILRKQVIQEMKDQWNDLKKLFKPVSKIRSSIQLRGVSFNGRGWA